MTLVRGDLDVLAQTIDDAGMKAAIEKSNAVHSRYLDIGVYAYRATYDILSGVSGGRQLMGGCGSFAATQRLYPGRDSWPGAYDKK